MHPIRRPRAPSEARICFCGDPKSAFYVITVATILSIVFLEDALRDLSLESKLLAAVPETNLGTSSPDIFKDLQPTGGKEKLPAVVGQSLILSNEGNGPSQNGDESNRLNHAGNPLTAGAVEDQERNRSVDPASRTAGQTSGSAGHRRSPNNVDSESLGATRNRLSSGSTSVRSASNKSSSESRWINIDEFRRRAEEKAMFDALKKRAALLAGDDVEENKEIWKLPKEDGDFIMTARDEQKKNATYQQLKTPEFRGVVRTKENSEVFRDDNITHLSFMVYRLVKGHNLTSLLDIPCTKSMYWMPEVLSRLEFEVPGFHYRCITPDDDYLVEAILRFKDLTSAVVLKDQNFWASKLPQSDIAFTWYGVGYLAPRRSWQLLKTIHQSKTKFVLIPNHPDVVSNPGSESRSGRVNVRRSPYRFDEAFRVVNNVSDTFPRKQLLMYELESLRSDVL